MGAKYIRGIQLEADSGNAPISIDLQVDGGTVAATFTATHNGRTVVSYAFATPFVAYETRLVPAGTIRIFGYRLIEDEYPDLKPILTSIDDNGYFGDKYIRGVVIEADTGGVAASVTVKADGVSVSPALSLTANGKTELDFTFSTPFIARELQLVPSGNVRIFKVRWIYDPYPELNRLITAITDEEKPGDKYFRGVLLEVDTGNAPATINVVADGAVAVTLTLTANGRSEKDFTFTPPFIAREIQLIPTSGNVRIFGPGTWTFDSYPNLNPMTTMWDDAGVKGAKYVQGMVLEADTNNVSISLQIKGDEGNLATTVTSVQHNGRSEKPYSWEPFITHQMQIVPQGNIRIFDIRWVFDIVPELTTTWKADNTSLEFPEYGHCYYAYIKHISTVNITLTLTIDGTAYTYTIPHSGGVAVKTRVPLQPIKGKLFQFGLASTAPFRLYHNQSVVWAKPFKSTGPYEPKQPFGEVSAEAGARI